MNQTNQNQKTALETAYDRALESAKIDMDSARWITSRRLEVTISGVPVSVDVPVLTEAGVKEALADALNLYCARTAALAVAGGSR